MIHRRTILSNEVRSTIAKDALEEVAKRQRLTYAEIDAAFDAAVSGPFVRVPILRGSSTLLPEAGEAERW